MIRRNRRLRPLAMLAVAMVVTAVLAGGLLSGEDEISASTSDYVGAQTCGDCHLEEYNDWVVSGHPYMLAQDVSAQYRPIPLPEGYRWSDVSYVVGGYKWKARYLDNDGYFITSTAAGEPGKNQFNLMTGKWANYHAGEDEKPYKCGSCHTTGYPSEGNQGDMPGMVGTWEFEGVQCERCHGPGLDHVNEGEPMSVDPSAEACGSCHIRGDAATIPAKGGFIRHHEQYNEFLASPHSDLDCVDCHGAHKKAEFSIEKECTDCHGDIGEAYAGTPMDVASVTCADCHMPMATKSAESLGPHKGDVKTHLFSINVSRDGQMFTDDGAFVQLDEDGKGSVTLDFACGQCHEDKSTKWLAGKAKKFHERR